MTTRRFLLSALLLGSLLCASSALAHPRGPGAPYVVTVEDRWGHELPTYHQRGHTFVMGDYGNRYKIRVRNRSGRRIEAVVSVDGRDAVSGRLGDYVNERGYIIEPHDSVVVEGFRKSLSEVATFRFTNPGNSYSSRMGTPQNVGVIGVAVFREFRRPRPVPYRPRPRLRSQSRPHPRPRGDLDDGAMLDNSYRSRDGAAAEAPAPSAAPAKHKSAHRGGRRHGSASGSAASERAASAPMDQRAEAAPRNNLGTEYGEDRHSQVTEVRFRRENRKRPTQLITLSYDNEQGLLARGIQVHPRRAPLVRNSPQAFPNSRFAPPPPRY